MEFHLNSYKIHQDLKHEAKLIKTWKNSNTVDYWRHERMYHQLDPIIMAYPNSKWLTVGDGRYGTDAHYLNQSGIDALPTDINDECLKLAKEEGFIPGYAVENAEKLSFDDNHFDFVLCKESYHHFPRPMLALYEMLRVAKNGIVLIEPNDQAILHQHAAGISSLKFWLWFSLKQFIKRKLNRRVASFNDRYESVGNYVYSISKREIEKIALGLNFDAIAIKGLNDYYVEGVEYEEIEKNGPLFKQVQENIRRMDKISSRRPETYGLLVAIIFKRLPNQVCIDLLIKQKFEFIKLTKNPYCKV